MYTDIDWLRENLVLKSRLLFLITSFMKQGLGEDLEIKRKVTAVKQNIWDLNKKYIKVDPKPFQMDNGHMKE